MVGVSAPVDPSPDRLAGAETCRDEVKESSWVGNGRKLELICLDSGGGGGSSLAWGSSLAVPGGGEVDVAGNPIPLPVWALTGRAEFDAFESPLSLLKLVDGASVAAAPNDGPKTFSKDLSFCCGAEGEVAKGELVPISVELPWRRKKGLLALIVEGAGLAT